MARPLRLEFRARRHREGAVAVLVAVALVVLLGMVAMSLDVGALTVTAQRAQNTADAAALAAAHSDMSTNTAAALSRADDVVIANHDATHSGVTWDPNEAAFYYAGDTVPGFRMLTGFEEAVTVTTREPVKFNFAPAVGVNGTTVVRNATAARLFAAGAPMVPMWIGIGTPCNYGVSQDLHQVDSPGADLCGCRATSGGSTRPEASTSMSF
jgi:Flp pilus assembly protein TadG